MWGWEGGGVGAVMLHLVYGGLDAGPPGKPVPSWGTCCEHHTVCAATGRWQPVAPAAVDRSRRRVNAGAMPLVLEVVLPQGGVHMIMMSWEAQCIRVG